MKFSELECCPFCGHDEYYTKEYAYGTVCWRSRFDGEEADNSEFYEALNFKSKTARAYCRKCNRYLGDKEKDTVSRAVEKMGKGDV